MGIKTILILILFVALGIFLLTTESGRKYLAFIQGKLGELIEVVPTIKPEKTFITLSVTPEKLRDKTFSITNSTFRGYGIYKEVIYEKTRIESEREVAVSMQVEKGKLTFTKDGNIRIFASTRGFELGNIRFTPETPVDVSIELGPINFTLSNIQEESITFIEISGELRGAKGTVIILENRSFAIHKFIGDLTYVNQTVSLSGNTTKVLINGNDVTNIVS